MGLELSSRINRDALFMVPRGEVASVAHEALFPINHLKGEKLAAGVALLFAAVASRIGMDPEELYRLGRRILTEPYPHHRHSTSQLDALQDFAGLRINTNPAI